MPSESTHSRGEGSWYMNPSLVRGGGLISRSGRSQGRGLSACINSSVLQAAKRFGHRRKLSENKYRYWQFLWQEICFLHYFIFSDSFRLVNSNPLEGQKGYWALSLAAMEGLGQLQPKGQSPTVSSFEGATERLWPREQWPLKLYTS